ncbi:hypothetical protein BEL04_02865 [Mucilaginibacter sp. PPCGB 2223]|uniref:DUF1800 domain-containing protein n=1 Tax=Mucilaginibacter sp. PPCGB 2223 TaxID=1886027 RepID=UPI0008269C7A|nr:DUF1800 domain-containing protein [Mucilaginibacter sp. PPCGB 2223]OCX53263.1 hypothetical protein BEL04_02865 [Mucilaginibacter sp. PPCGB 2223]
MRVVKYISLAFFIGACAILFSSFFASTALSTKKIKLAYKSAGLTDRQAAAHLLSRFTYGATPGEIDAVIKMGLENWLQHQLNADLPDDSLNNRLKLYDALNYTNEQVVDVFPERGAMYRNAVKAGYVSKDSLYVAKDKKAFNARIQVFMQVKGYRPEQELLTQFESQKILRATYGNNQLQEVLTEFWFNHFNVSFAKNGPGKYIPAYERDVIRPHVFGKFDELLLGTAKSPAMLFYLDNFNSVGPPPERKQPQIAPQPQEIATNNMMLMDMPDSAKKKLLTPAPQPLVRRNVSGLNENYAREVMELHTLGVDGGYTQSDVTQAARVLTGWTYFPEGEDNVNNNGIRKQFIKQGDEVMAEQGYMHDGDFLFNPTRHDKGEKTVLGHHFGKNGGYQEGVDLLEMLAHHPSTAKFISRKLAVRFVSDNPPQSLLDKMSKSFMEHDGDIKEVLITMVSSPEFWSKDALREKTKSPFELAVSSMRALNADIKQPMQVYNWVGRMGERLYYYLAPTGFPDRGTYWINTGSLLNRMNFGLALTTGRIPGVTVNLAALNNNHEPESPEAALAIYSKLVMPERNLDKTIQRLTPLLNQPDLAATVNNAAANTIPAQAANKPAVTNPMMSDNMMQQNVQPKDPARIYARAQIQPAANNTMLAQVVGIIIGSPEYQRR